MSQRFQVETLPQIDQQQIKRGICPWCLARLADMVSHDQCPDCLDTFYGKLTLED